jgi:hypothetical protein
MFDHQISLSVAERPINFHATFKIGVESMPFIQLPAELLWAKIELTKNMAIGHDVEALIQFFTSMNISDSSAIFLAMTHVASLGHRYESSPPATPALPAACQAATQRDCDDDGDEPKYWNMESGVASFRTTFDPASRQRIGIIANPRLAIFYGAHPEEFQVTRDQIFRVVKWLGWSIC